MKAIVKTVTNDTYTFSGDVVRDLYAYFTQGTRNGLPLGWVSTSGNAVNFNHVIHIEFREDDAS